MNKKIFNPKAALKLLSNMDNDIKTTIAVAIKIGDFDNEYSFGRNNFSASFLD